MFEYSHVEGYTNKPNRNAKVRLSFYTRARKTLLFCTFFALICDFAIPEFTIQHYLHIPKHHYSHARMRIYIMYQAACPKSSGNHREGRRTGPKGKSGISKTKIDFPPKRQKSRTIDDCSALRLFALYPQFTSAC